MKNMYNCSQFKLDNFKLISFCSAKFYFIILSVSIAKSVKLHNDDNNETKNEITI